ncbi:hypothetical protein SCP_1700160 [Sparassis crispa]|uniref:DUF6535 domain-containing protein n=1 Tax=Sparassis crispa TaxID=139825 RepID=A0A401H5K4_9APHY|nr:hypothetical protein SCP_1700160 [Sparassis crispa]GBE89692.1 hypothetical protein SCP_1700160 [Sparassis crispa]
MPVRIGKVTHSRRLTYKALDGEEEEKTPLSTPSPRVGSIPSRIRRPGSAARPNRRTSGVSLAGGSKPEDKAGSSTVAYTAWSECARILENHANEARNRWVEHIDSLLTFAGLFSGVLTAFIIATYQDVQGTSKNIAFTTVFYNTMWFASLGCSLLSASIGILVKEWLREYLIELPEQPRDIVRVRRFRHYGVHRWGVQMVVSAISLLLQISVAFFLAAFLCFAWKLNKAVAIMLTVIVTFWISFWMLTATAPVFSASCPYKSPLSWLLFTIASFGEKDDVVRERRVVTHDGQRWDRDALVHINNSLVDRKSLQEINDSCLNDLTPADAMSCVVEILEERVLRSSVRKSGAEHGLPHSGQDKYDDGTADLTAILVDRLLAEDARSEPVQLSPKFLSILTAVSGRSDGSASFEGPGGHVCGSICEVVVRYGRATGSPSEVCNILWDNWKSCLQRCEIPADAVSILIEWARGLNSRTDVMTFVKTCILSVHFATYVSSVHEQLTEEMEEKIPEEIEEKICQETEEKTRLFDDLRVLLSQAPQSIRQIAVENGRPRHPTHWNPCLPSVLDELCIALESLAGAHTECIPPGLVDELRRLYRAGLHSPLSNYAPGMLDKLRQETLERSGAGVLAESDVDTLS